MTTPFPGWVLDPARNQYYYYSAEENAYVYQTGEKIHLQTPAPSAASAQPRTVPPVSGRQPQSQSRREKEKEPAKHRRDKDRDRDRQRDRERDRERERERREMERLERDREQFGEAQKGFSGLEIGTSDYTYGTPDFKDPYIQMGPAPEITDPRLAGLGLQARGRLRGSPRINEALYPDYKRRRGQFFVSGKVFKALWPELLGQPNESVTVTSETRINEEIATKIRWFIVVNQGDQHCTCLPIVTYNKQGVAKLGVVKQHHAIAYTSSQEPQPERNERPTSADLGPMLPGIRIVPKTLRSKLDKMMRVDFSRMYTVEHNVKVFDFGDIHPAHLGRLQSQWITTITSGPTISEGSQEEDPEGEELEQELPEEEEPEDEEPEEEEAEEKKGKEEKYEEQELDTDFSGYSYYRKAKTASKQPQLDPPGAAAPFHQDTHSQAASNTGPTHPDGQHSATPGTKPPDQPGTVTPSTELLRPGTETHVRTFVISESDEKDSEDGNTQTRSSMLKSSLDHATLSDFTKRTPYSTLPTDMVVTSGPKIQSLHQAEPEPMLNAEGENYDGNYSDAGSIADHEEIYANILSNEILQDLKVTDWGHIEPMLCAALEEFAVRLGHQGESRNHRNMMYIVHKHRRKIARRIYPGQSVSQEEESSTQSGDTASGRKHSDDAYYRDKQNIESWIQNESTVIEADPPTTDPWDELLTTGLESLRESEAYKWLISILQRDVKVNGIQPTGMRGHHQWFLALLDTATHQGQATKPQRISRRRKPDLYTAQFELAWDLMGFLQEQEYPDEDLSRVIGRVITLSGDHECVQALTCAKYMEQVWPLTGPDFVQLFERLVEHPDQTHSCVLSDGTRISAKFQGKSVYFEATGTKYGLAEVVEQLFWISTALQTPTDEPGVSLNSADASATVSIHNNFQRRQETGQVFAQHVGAVHCKVGFQSHRQQTQPTRGNCWHNLFRHCAIVSGYPIPPRPSQRLGLDIPLDMMAALADADRMTTICGNLVLKGFSTLLFPTHIEDKTMFWHLIYNEDGSRVSFTDPRIIITPEMESVMRRLRPEDANDSQHVIGWSAELKNNVGAMDGEYSIGWSALSTPSNSFALKEVQVTAGQYVTIGGTFARGNRERAVHSKRQDGYLKGLESIGDKFIVLHDVNVRKAWLADGVSALLHLVRANLFYNCRRNKYGITYLAKPEDLQSIGGGKVVAFQALTDEKNLKIRLYRKAGKGTEEGKPEEDVDFHCLFDTIKNIMHTLEQIFDHQTDERSESSAGHRIRMSPLKQLEGFDFMDVATNCDTVWPRATTLRSDGEGWVGLTRAIHAITLFGDGFGELLEPARRDAPDQCPKCCWNGEVPAQRDVLAVSISELEQIVERRGSKSSTSWRLVDDFYLDITPELFSDCSTNRLRTCHQLRIQRIRQRTTNNHDETPTKWNKLGHLLRSISSSSSQLDRTTLAAENEASLDISTGGVLLGITVNRLQKSTQQSTDTKERLVTTRDDLYAPNSQPRLALLTREIGRVSSSRNTATVDGSTARSLGSQSTTLTNSSR